LVSIIDAYPVIAAGQKTGIGRVGGKGRIEELGKMEILPVQANPKYKVPKSN
jgi:hypothetical protein